MVTVIGAGLAGSEAAWQLARRRLNVNLIEMRPEIMTKAHRTAKPAELVCSNSFRGAALSNAVGLLKEELRLAGSLIMEAADASAVPAGGALAVDRVKFSDFIEARLSSSPFIQRRTAEITSVPESSVDAPVIIATGPLTSKPLALDIQALVGAANLSFFDAISPVIAGDSIDFEQLFRQSRYDKGDGDDYWNIPLDREQYYAFVEQVRSAEKFGGHEEVESDEIGNLRPFEGCMPIDDMAERGVDTLLFGPMKPVGLVDPRTNKQPYAVIQLRQDNSEGTLWNLVGFQTRLRHGEQERIFRSLPGLSHAEFVRLGTVHRNTFIDSPKCLKPTLQFKDVPGLFFAGQMTGVEGYVESTAGGFVAGFNVARLLNGESPLAFPKETAMGALLAYISDTERKDFQPMNISFGLMPHYFAQPKRGVKKADRRIAAAQIAIRELKNFLAATGDQCFLPTA